MTSLEVLVYIWGPIWVGIGVYGIFLKRELNELQARRREKHPAE